MNAEDVEAYEIRPGSAVRDTQNGNVGEVAELGDEEALVSFPRLGDYWIPYEDLLPVGHVIGMD